MPLGESVVLRQLHLEQIILRPTHTDHIHSTHLMNQSIKLRVDHLGPSTRVDDRCVLSAPIA